MKTITLDDILTQTNRPAYRADAPISAEVAKHFYRLYSERFESGGIPVEIRDSVIYITTMKPPRGFPEFILGLLQQAEGFVAHDQDFERERQDVAAAEKKEFLKRIKDDKH